MKIFINCNLYYLILTAIERMTSPRRLDRVYHGSFLTLMQLSYFHFSEHNSQGDMVTVRACHRPGVHREEGLFWQIESKTARF